MSMNLNSSVQNLIRMSVSVPLSSALNIYFSTANLY